MTSNHRSRKRPHATSNARRRELTAAGVGALLIAIVVVVTFGRGAVAGGEELRAVFATGNQLKSGSVVRVAGLDVGSVSGVRANADGTATVTMKLDGDAPRIARDARFTIRPRLAFEGNFYVEVHPGSADVPAQDLGETVAIERTATPVQIDQLLTTFDSAVRESGMGAIGELARGLGGGSSASAPAGSRSGADGLRSAVDELERALPGLGVASRAMRGVEDGDLTRAIDGAGRFAETLGRDPRVLAASVESFHRAAAAIDGDGVALERALAASAVFLRDAPQNLRRIEASLPDIRAVARAATPALRALPPAARAGSRALREIRAVSAPSSLPRLARLLAPPLTTLAGVQQQLAFALPYVTDVAQCLADTVTPMMKSKLPDGHLSTNVPFYLEAAYAFSNLASNSKGFDANGSTYRVGLGQSEGLVQGLLPNGREIAGFIGSAGGGLTGVRPAWRGPTFQPEKRPDARCADQDVVDLRAESSIPFKGMKPVKSQAETSLTGTRSGLERLRDSLLPTDTSRSTSNGPGPARRAHGARPGSGTPTGAATVPAPGDASGSTDGAARDGGPVDVARTLLDDVVALPSEVGRAVADLLRGGGR